MPVCMLFSSNQLESVFFKAYLSLLHYIVCFQFVSHHSYTFILYVNFFANPFLIKVLQWLFNIKIPQLQDLSLPLGLFQIQLEPKYLNIVIKPQRNYLQFLASNENLPTLIFKEYEWGGGIFFFMPSLNPEVPTT